MASILETICTTTYTVADIHRRLGLLQECLEEVLYHGDATAAISRKEACLGYLKTVASEEDFEILRMWGDEIFETFTLQNLVAHIATLKQEANVLPSLILYVPVPLDTASLEKIGQWARKSINPQQMFEIHVDAEVTGGCAFVHNDTYYDFSLRHFMQSQKGVVTSLLSSYV